MARPIAFAVAACAALLLSPPGTAAPEGVPAFPPMAAEAPPCESCATEVLMAPTVFPLTPPLEQQSLSLGPVDFGGASLPFAVIGSYYDDRGLYCIAVDGNEPNCVNTLHAPVPVIPPQVIVGLPAQTLVPAQEATIPAAKGLALEVSAEYRWEPSMLVIQADTEGAGIVYAPIDLGSPAAWDWWKENSDRTSLVVRLTLREGGDVLDDRVINVPFVGQALAAAAQSEVV